MDISEKLALALGTKGLVNIQYLQYKGELYVIEVNPRASRTVPYISKVSGVPMVDLASQVMLGAKLDDLGYGTGLFRTPPYVAVKVPVFSFEKLTDANSILGPEMKSTGEVLGLGRTMNEALYKGLTAAGFTVPSRKYGEDCGVMISVQKRDYPEILPIALKLHALGMKLYATRGTAEAIRTTGIQVTQVQKAQKNNDIIDLMESGKTSYIIFTGQANDAALGDYTAVHKRAMQLGIPCLTSVDTAGALVNMIESRFTPQNTELVDINHMRSKHRNVYFTKLHSCGNDYIILNNYDGRIEGPESLCVNLCDRNRSIGGDGIVLVEKSRKADIRMRVFYSDGTEGDSCGNGIRCGAKFAYEEGLVGRNIINVETKNGVQKLKLFMRDGRVSSVINYVPEKQFMYDGETQKRAIADPRMKEGLAAAGAVDFRTCSIDGGGIHCQIFCESIDTFQVDKIGPMIEYSDIFQEPTCFEFLKVVDRSTLRMKVWDGANGAVMSSASAAFCAARMAVEVGYCDRDRDIIVETPGGDITISCGEDQISLSGEVSFAFSGKFWY